MKRITRGASERVARFACDYAERTGRRKVTAVHKANVLHLTDGLFLESARRVTAEWPSLEFADKMVDLLGLPGRVVARADYCHTVTINGPSLREPQG